MKRINYVDLYEFIMKSRGKHERMIDPDGFFICPVQDQLSMGIASKESWLGTEEERQESIRDKKKMDRMIYCDYCNLCKQLIKKFI